MWWRNYVRAVSPGRSMAMGHPHMQIPMHVSRDRAMDRRGDMGTTPLCEAPLKQNARTNNAAGIAF